MEIDDLIKEAFNGSTRQAQEALGVTKQAISNWRRRGIPPMRRYHIEAVLRERKEPANANA